MKNAKHLNFNINRVPEVIAIINRLAELEKRKPHDSAKRLILEEGQRKIQKLQGKQCETPSVA